MTVICAFAGRVLRSPRVDCGERLFSALRVVNHSEYPVAKRVGATCEDRKAAVYFS